MTTGSAMALPASVKASAPAAARSPISVSSRPRSPLVAAAYVRMRAKPTSRERRATNSTSAASSITGSVLGSATMVVTPPATAASPPEVIDSWCSAPGSRSSTRMSTRPGARQAPAQSITSLSRLPRATVAISAMRPSSTRRSPARSKSLAGSSRRALRKRVRVAIKRPPQRCHCEAPKGRRGNLPPRRAPMAAGDCFAALAMTGWAPSHGRHVADIAAEHFEARHAHGDAHLDLLADGAAVDVVGDVGVDLDAAVHRSRMHDERVGLGGGELGVVEAEEVEILADRRHEAAMHALGLEPQHHDDVDVLQSPCHVVEDLDAQALDLRRQERARRHHAHARAHGVEEGDVGARDAAVQDVAADGDEQAL